MNRLHGFTVRVTTCARHQLRSLSAVERELVEGHLAQLAVYLGTHAPPAAHRAVAVSSRLPGILELRIWPFLLLYEASAEQRSVTVLHVLRLPQPPPAHAEHRLEV